jgi:hypothetical protein
MSLALLRARMAAIDRGGADAARRLSLRYKHASYSSLVQGIIDNPEITNASLAHGLRIRHLPCDPEAVAALRRMAGQP